MRLFRTLALVAGAFLLLVQAAGAQGLNPLAVVDSYERAWAQHDVDGALAHFADNAVVTLHVARTRSLTGRQQIRDFMQSGSAPVLTSNRQSDGAVVQWSERTEDSRFTTTRDVTVQAVVRDGKIQSLVYRPGRMVGAEAPATSNITPQSAGLALGAVLLLGLGLLSLATIRPRVCSRSKLSGRLLRDLGHWHTRLNTA